MAIDRPSAAWDPPRQTIPVSPCLWAAARANDLAQMIRLLDEGSPIDERDQRGYSPLMLAGYAGHLEAVKLLLVRGADPNTADYFGNTVLMGAAYKGFVEVVQCLLAAGADPALTNNGGLDARGFALTYGREDVFAILDQLAKLAESAALHPMPALPAPPQAVLPSPAPPHIN